MQCVRRMIWMNIEMNLRSTGFTATAALFALMATAFVSTPSHSASSQSIKVCSGYGCIISDRFSFTAADNDDLIRSMASATGSAASERAAIAQTIGLMERMARAKLRYRPDVRKAYQKNSAKRGQMDCVDESLNTTAYLKHLQRLGLLKFHTPNKRYAERGFILDGRYPHKSALITDQSGKKWTVDSWYGDDGQPAQVMEHAKWRKVRDSF